MRLLIVAAALAGSCTVSPATPASHIAARSAATHDSGSPHLPPLAGVVVGIDPGHNGHNYMDPAYINHTVWNGREQEACDTTGTETNAGYPEPRFTFRVAKLLAADLRQLGADVVMTRHDNHGVGPCIDRRARILNRARATVAIDLHADGGPASGRGFAILEPVKSTVNRRVVGASAVLGRVVRHKLLTMTGMPTSSYDGHRGIAHRDDLAGLNLATQPKVLVECGNMRNARDARKLVSTHFQRRLAAAFTAAVTRYLRISR
ncbi:MAG TPA: N-acetylmuramoyl-L-alanine amidase [Mycobacteriales bacterium]|jgi:N-acetylmuramoyl-L-alanine amidase|nr:N-acetylmuramoyl-L-alanine amidase [Mycobacteriales bacterium]